MEQTLGLQSRSLLLYTVQWQLSFLHLCYLSVVMLLEKWNCWRRHWNSWSEHRVSRPLVQLDSRDLEVLEVLEVCLYLLIGRSQLCDLTTRKMDDLAPLRTTSWGAVLQQIQMSSPPKLVQKSCFVE